tara:strand:+ start:376 stop:1254 length:879 start_codon:yes stop_codon:yes gene_type:complete
MSEPLDVEKELEEGRKLGNQTFFKNDTKNLLVVTRGHPFERDNFFNMVDSLGFNWSHIEHPAAQSFFKKENLKKFDAILFYDMPGLNFDEINDESKFFINPPQEYKDDFLERLSEGKGCIFLHHSIAGWPMWDEYSNIIGGRFLYKPGKIKGKKYPDSGYRHFVNYKVSSVSEHPITKGISDFEIEDELYLSHVFEEDINPLLKSNYSFVRDNFYSATNALNGKMNSNEGWEHPDGSNLVGWTKSYKKSAITYLQFGDGVKSYENKNVRMLLRRSINWVIEETKELKKVKID